MQIGSAGDSDFFLGYAGNFRFTLEISGGSERFFFPSYDGIFFTLTLEKSWARPTTGRKRTNFGVTLEFFRVSLESFATCPVPFSDLRWKLLRFLSYVGNHRCLPLI